MLTLLTHFEGSLRWFAEEMTPRAKDLSIRLIFSEEDGGSLLVHLVFSLTIVSAVRVDIRLGHVLTTEGTDHFVFLKFAGVAVNELSPLIHLMSCLLVEFLLVEVVLFLELLREFPNDIILELKKLALLFVMLEKHLALS